jgi:pyridinium-3,5-biscarboxylic acid mononucleotide sulfurtransferase
MAITYFTLRKWTKSICCSILIVMNGKLERLQNILREYESVCVGYSGGVDSVFLAHTALDVLGADNMIAVIGISASFPAVQRDMALQCARDFGIPFVELPTDEMNDPNYVANPNNRCYFCKTELWTKLTAFASARGFSVVADGTNADDVGDHRPGMEAANEHAIRSPLLEAGLTKAEIRVLSQAAGLPTWDMPSAPCLSSRLAYGVSVTPERLQQVETAEERIRGLGFREFRVRHHDTAARLEFSSPEIPRALELAPDIYQCFDDLGFERVLLDVEGYRRGALNEAVQLVTITQKNEGEIATLSAPLAEFDEVRSLVPALKAEGFKFVTIDLKSERP